MYSQRGPEKWRAKRKPGCAGQGLEERPVAVLEGRLEDRGEVPDRLVVVDGEQEDEIVHAVSCSSDPFLGQDVGEDGQDDGLELELPRMDARDDVESGMVDVEIGLGS